MRSLEKVESDLVIEESHMFNRVWIVALLLIAGLGKSVAQPTAKLKTISRVNALIGQFLKIAEKCVAHRGEPDVTSLDREIGIVLQKERDPDVLARVALVSYIYSYPGNAGEQNFDEVFRVAWDACIRRIGQIGGQPAIDALEYIAQNTNLDGASSLLWKETMARLKAK
jgi:hypothetical protein